MELGRYYIDLNRWLGEDFSEYEFDKQGVPLAHDHHQPNWRHNPITVCQYGLHHFNKFLRSQSQPSKAIFLTQAKWLVEHVEQDNNGSLVWWYPFDIPFYKIIAPWISGMAQGQALSVLLRAHQLTGDEGYLDTAEGAWQVFSLTVDRGGVIARFPDGKPLVEEYPSLKFLTAVLNGFIFAMFGVYDYAVYTKNKFSNELFFQLSDSLKHNLPRYDSGYWSYYELKVPARLASKSYHRIHIEQLDQLYQITGERVFKTFYNRWQQYLLSKTSNLKWLVRKIEQKLLLRNP